MSRYKVIAPHPLDLPDGTTAAPGDFVTLDSRGEFTDRELVAVPEPDDNPGDVPGDADPDKPEQSTIRHRKAKTTEESA